MLIRNCRNSRRRITPLQKDIHESRYMSNPRLLTKQTHAVSGFLKVLFPPNSTRVKKVSSLYLARIQVRDRLFASKICIKDFFSLYLPTPHLPRVGLLGININFRITFGLDFDLAI